MFAATETPPPRTSPPYGQARPPTWVMTLTAGPRRRRRCRPSPRCRRTRERIGHGPPRSPCPRPGGARRTSQLRLLLSLLLRCPVVDLVLERVALAGVEAQQGARGLLVGRHEVQLGRGHARGLELVVGVVGQLPPSIR